jgi:LDH2 family malate/lactate/ureidoglycolate dehydrogenase
MTGASQTSTTNATHVVPVGETRAYIQRIFEQHSMPPDDARLLADHFVWAERRGQRWLGVRRVPEYIDRLVSGATAAQPEVKVVSDRGAFQVLDGGDGWGHVVGARAMNIAVARARDFGIAGVSVRNTTSAGAVGYYALLAAEQGMIGLAINNSQPIQAAWGGSESLVGAEAFAVSCPAGRHAPLLVDMATSSFSQVGIKKLRDRGEPLPAGAALTADGQPTMDPEEALRGVILPMAGHRGYGLAVLFETLTGVLAGGTRFGADVGRFHDCAEAQGMSLFMLAVDPTVSMPYEEFTARVDTLIDQMHASPTVPSVDRVLVPGERSHNTAVAADRDGLSLPAEVFETLERLGSELGVPPPPP